MYADSNLCAFNITGFSGAISSISSGNHKECSWLITTASDHKIRLRFTTFQFSYLPSEWVQAFMFVYNGKTTKDTLTGVYTGTRKPFTVHSSGRLMLLKLSLHGYRYQSATRNFKATYTSTSGIGKLYSLILIHVYLEHRLVKDYSTSAWWIWDDRQQGTYHLGSSDYQPLYGKWAHVHPRRDDWTREPGIVNFNQWETCLLESKSQHKLASRKLISKLAPEVNM